MAVLGDGNICILIPVYNESKTIVEVVRSIVDKKFNVVVIDDGSKDNSGKLAKDNGAYVLFHEKNQGKGASLRDGFKYILGQGFDAVITMDGDGQHAVCDIERFLQAAKGNKSTVVIGNRMGNTKGMPWLRKMTNRFMSALISLAARQPVADTQCGFRYIGCQVLKSIELKCDSFEIETEIILKAAKQGFPIVSVSIQTIYRDEESKINPLKDTIRFIKYFFRELAAKQ